MNKWTPVFDPKREKLNVLSIWVHIMGLPLEFWTCDAFQHIVNVIDTFLEAGMSFKQIYVMSVSRMLVKIDVQNGLLKEMRLVRGENSFVQTLGYKGIPFRCRRCYEFKHISSDCSFFSHGSRQRLKKVHKDVEEGG